MVIIFILSILFVVGLFSLETRKDHKCPKCQNPTPFDATLADFDKNGRCYYCDKCKIKF